MSEMVERVYKAIAENRCTESCDNPSDCFCRQDALTAIRAMREPTAAVIKAHHLVPEDNDFDERAARNWEELIDACLD